jgi:hypothetical protein
MNYLTTITIEKALEKDVIFINYTPYFLEISKKIRHQIFQIII